MTGGWESRGGVGLEIEGEEATCEGPCSTGQSGVGVFVGKREIRTENRGKERLTVRCWSEGEVEVRGRGIHVDLRA